MTQNHQILNYLNQGYTLTPIEALKMFGCFRLSARILDLKISGYDIISEPVEIDGKHFARYRLQNPFVNL
jgi:hypothetical protein